MRGKCVGMVVGCVLAAALMYAGPASAATLVGSDCQANEASLESTVVSLRSPVGGLPGVIPTAGVITNWTFSVTALEETTTEFAELLKVFAPTGAPGQFRVVAESGRHNVGLGGVTSVPDRIPVAAGDLLGNSLLATQGALSANGALYCKTTGSQADELAFFEGDPIPGQVVTPSKTVAGDQNPITVTVEPDADGDGYGDETQDGCPSDASTHGPCPVPAPPVVAPISLKGSAAAKGSVVTVTLTSSAGATVTVGGSAKLGKGGTAKLSGGTQLVAPGSLAKFTVVLPAKVTKALKALPKSRKLSLALTASAPGATTANLTAKPPRRAPAKAHHHGKGAH